MTGSVRETAAPGHEGSSTRAAQRLTDHPFLMKARCGNASGYAKARPADEPGRAFIKVRWALAA
jgi:hypothetical protein